MLRELSPTFLFLQEYIKIKLPITRWVFRWIKIKTYLNQEDFHSVKVQV